jgi:hypothetical protein
MSSPLKRKAIDHIEDFVPKKKVLVQINKRNLYVYPDATPVIHLNFKRANGQTPPTQSFTISETLSYPSPSCNESRDPSAYALAPISPKLEWVFGLPNQAMTKNSSKQCMPRTQAAPAYLS